MLDPRDQRRNDRHDQRLRTRPDRRDEVQHEQRSRRELRTDLRQRGNCARHADDRRDRAPDPARRTARWPIRYTEIDAGSRLSILSASGTRLELNPHRPLA